MSEMQSDSSLIASVMRPLGVLLVICVLAAALKNPFQTDHSSDSWSHIAKTKKSETIKTSDNKEPTADSNNPIKKEQKTASKSPGARNCEPLLRNSAHGRLTSPHETKNSQESAEADDVWSLPQMDSAEIVPPNQDETKKIFYDLPPMADDGDVGQNDLSDDQINQKISNLSVDHNRQQLDQHLLNSPGPINNRRQARPSSNSNSVEINQVDDSIIFPLPNIDDQLDSVLSTESGSRFPSNGNNKKKGEAGIGIRSVPPTTSNLPQKPAKTDQHPFSDTDLLSDNSHPVNNEPRNHNNRNILNPDQQVDISDPLVSGQDPESEVPNLDQFVTEQPKLIYDRIHARFPDQERLDTQPTDWWKFQVGQEQRKDSQVRPVGLDDLVTSALQISPRIKFLKKTPQLAKQDVEEAQSLFDPLFQIDSMYNDTVDPVGNTLTTGGEPFLEDNTWSGTVGIRRKLRNGVESRVYQTLGFQNSNSTFFTPQDQGTATFGIDFTMPLLRDAGVEVNQAPVIVAELESGIAWNEYRVELQNELYEIATIYWTLYNSRIQVLLRQRSLRRAESIFSKLKARSDYDTSPTQISQAQAEVSIRRSELQEAYLSVREQEISLRERIGKQDFRTEHNVEIIPSDLPDDWYPIPNQDLNTWINLALNQREELKRDQARSEITQQQVVIGKSGLAPKLDLIFGVSTSALEGDSGVGQAFTKQFGSTTPGFRVGIDYELPFGRRLGRAQLERARIQHRQRLDSIEVQKNTIISEVGRAYSFLEISNRNYLSAYKAAEDIRKSVVQLRQRWEKFAFLEGAVSEGATPSLALDRLLSGQRRLTEAETRLATAELNRVTARLRIALVTGSLLKSINDERGFSFSQAGSSNNYSIPPATDLSDTNVHPNTAIPKTNSPTRPYSGPGGLQSSQ